MHPVSDPDHPEFTASRASLAPSTALRRNNRLRDLLLFTASSLSLHHFLEDVVPVRGGLGVRGARPSWSEEKLTAQGDPDRRGEQIFLIWSSV